VIETAIKCGSNLSDQLLAGQACGIKVLMVYQAMIEVSNEKKALSSSYSVALCLQRWPLLACQCKACTVAGVAGVHSWHLQLRIHTRQKLRSTCRLETPH
jgi:hypothetical protein